MYRLFHVLYICHILNVFILCSTCFALFAFFLLQCHCLGLNYLMFCLICLFELLLLDLASIFLSIPPSPSFLMNDSDVFLPEASGKKCVRSVYQTVI